MPVPLSLDVADGKERRRAELSCTPKLSTDLAVQCAIAIQAQWGTISAVEYLKSGGLQADVALRVLDAHGARSEEDATV